MVLFFVAILPFNTTAQEVQQAQVPAAVLNTFKEKFANVAEIKWNLKDDLYRAEFEVGSRGHDVWIDKTGKITKHKEDFPKKQLPPSVQQQLTTEFKSYKLDDADKIEMDGKVFYQVKLKGAADNRTILFTPEGKIQETNVD